MLTKIILTAEQHDLIIKEIIAEMLYSENNTLNENEVLNEDMWEKVKYGLSKLGRYKAGGKIFGKGKVDAEAAERIKAILDKKENEIISKLNAWIKQENPKFPNNEKEVDFLNIIMNISAVYDTIVASTNKSSKEEGYLPIEAANAIINGLREYVKKFLDVDLTAVYSVVDEAEGNTLDLTEDELNEIDEAWELNEVSYDISSTKDGDPDETDVAKSDLAGNIRGRLQNKRGQGDDFGSQRMDTLKSNKLPLTLFGVGSALGAFSWLVNTAWFKNLFDTISQTTNIENIQQTVESKSDIFGSIKPGEGMTQLMNELNNAGLSPNSTPEQFLEQVKALGGGDVQAGINALSENSGIFSHPDQAKAVLMDIAKNPHGHGDNLGQIFKGKWAGTGKSIGDALVTVTGGQLKAVIVKTIVTAVPKIITRTAVKTGAGYAVAKGLGAVLGPIGVGLVAAGAVVKLMRMNGQKQSRAKTLNDLYQSIRNIDGGVGIIKPEGETISKEEAQNPKKIQDKNNGSGVARGTSNVDDDLYNSLKNLFQFVVNNRKKLGVRSADNVGTGVAKNSMFTAGEQRYFTTNDGKKQVVTVLKTPEGWAYGKDKVFVKGKGGNSFAASKSSLGDAIQSGAKKPNPLSDRSKFEENIILNKPYIFEGKFIKDKRLLQFLQKSLSFDKLKSFEDFIGRVEIIRNKVRKLGKSDDKVINDFFKKFSSNPLMATNFEQLFNVSADNPQAVNSLKAFIDDIFITVYSGKFKYGNMIDKMATVGDGNVNKLEEESGYNFMAPNKSFVKDAQDRRTFKKNLLAFLSNSVSLFQYLHKVKTQGPSTKKSGDETGNANNGIAGGETDGKHIQKSKEEPKDNNDSTQGDNGESKEEPKQAFKPATYRFAEESKINEEINRIKKIMKDLD